MPEKMKYGGYVSYPLAPKDVKLVRKLVDETITPDDMLSIIHNFCQDEFGVRIEPNEDRSGWKVVVWNMVPVREGDDHSYYLSGESDSLAKALCVVKYKLGTIRNDIWNFVSVPSREEFR